VYGQANVNERKINSWCNYDIKNTKADKSGKNLPDSFSKTKVECLLTREL